MGRIDIAQVIGMGLSAGSGPMLNLYAHCGSPLSRQSLLLR